MAEIIGLRIKNIKRARGYLDLNLSHPITRISGPNAAGKSSILLGLQLFTGMYSLDDLKNFITWGEDHLESTVFMNDDTHITACVTLESKNPEIKHYHTPSGEVINHWDGFYDTLKQYLGLTSIELPTRTIPLSTKSNKDNILLDTTAKENEIIIREMTADRNIELKIDKMREDKKLLEENKKIVGEKLDTVSKLYRKLSIRSIVVENPEELKIKMDRIDELLMVMSLITVLNNISVIKNKISIFNKIIDTTTELKLSSCVNKYSKFKKINLKDVYYTVFGLSLIAKTTKISKAIKFKDSLQKMKDSLILSDINKLLIRKVQIENLKKIRVLLISDYLIRYKNSLNKVIIFKNLLNNFQIFSIKNQIIGRLNLANLTIKRKSDFWRMLSKINDFSILGKIYACRNKTIERIQINELKSQFTNCPTCGSELKR